MPLVFGTGLGPYEIAGALGSSGMGEVHRALSGIRITTFGAIARVAVSREGTLS